MKYVNDEYMIIIVMTDGIHNNNININITNNGINDSNSADNNMDNNNSKRRRMKL